MNIGDFSQLHPQMYRRFLGLCCIALAAAGLHHSLFSDKPQGLVLDRLAMQLPQQQQVDEKPRVAETANVTSEPSKTTALAGLTRLPGKDGSGALPAVTNTAAVSSATEGEMRKLGRAMNAAHFGDGQWLALNNLWTRESNWNPAARNRSSGACGIPQALPCSKIPDMSPEGQIRWGLSYIERRYGTPANAWQHWLRYNWY